MLICWPALEKGIIMNNEQTAGNGKAKLNISAR